MFVGVHGEFVVRTTEGTVSAASIKGRRTRRALAYLVLNRHRAVPTDELAVVLWRGAPPASWPSSVREVLTHCRKVLSAVGIEGAISSRDRCVRVRFPEHTVVDVEVALEAATRLCQGFRLGTLDAAEAVELAEAVLAMSPGDLLPGESGEWIDGLRRDVARSRTEAQVQLAAIQLRDGQMEAALDTASAVTEQSPLTERAYLLQMQALAGLDRRAAALEVFARCRRLLRDELGVDPSSELVSLNTELLRADRPGLQPDPEPCSAQREPRGRHRVAGGARRPKPGPPTCSGYDVPLVGRGAELSRAVAALRADPSTPRQPSHGVKVVLVTGEMGAGKTRLLHDLVARQLLPDGPVVYGHCLPGGGTAGGALREAFMAWELDPGQPIEWATFAAVDGMLPGVTTVMLDDVHLADDVTRRFIAQLVRSRPAAPVNLVLTARTQEVTADASAVLADLHRALRPTLVHLGPLAPASVAELAAAMTGEDIAASLVQEVHEASGGTPLYAVELLRLEGTDVADIRTRATRSAALAALVRDRVRVLSPLAARMLRAAASRDVIDPLELIRDIDRWEPERCLDALEELLAAGLLRTPDDDDAVLVFRHGIVRDVLAGRVGGRQRQAVLRRLRAAAGNGPQAARPHAGARSVLVSG